MVGFKGEMTSFIERNEREHKDMIESVQYLVHKMAEHDRDLLVLKRKQG